MSENKSNAQLIVLDSMRNGATVRLRLQWMDDRLWWVGSLNRSDLVLRFGISPPQATNDFSLYQNLAPTNIKYDPKKKLYVCGNDFVPLFPKNHEQWLKNSMAEDEALQTIKMIEVGSLKRGISPDVVQFISRSTRNKVPLRITYQSMKSTEPEERVISPHAIVETEIRWHIRAWDEKRQKFLDLVPSRILNAIPEPSVVWVHQERDEQWYKLVDIILVPSQNLSENQRRIAETDYGMTNGQRIIKARACLVYYQLSAMYLVDAVRYHEGQPIERDFGVKVENWKELQSFVMEFN